MLPVRIGGPKPEEKKPGMVIAVSVGKKIPGRIGGPREEEAPEGESEPMSNDMAKDEAVRELKAGLESGSDSQIKSALEAFVYACGDDQSTERTEQEGEE